MTRTLRQRLAIAGGALVVAFLTLEVGVRLLAPPPQMVEIDDLVTLRSAPGAKQEVTQKESHSSVIDWSGHKGVRLRKNMRANIINHVLSKRDVTIETNSLGLRYPEVGPKEPGEFRVLVLGDSITFGDFVDAAERYTELLEGLAGASSRRIRFVNAGLPGSSTSDEFYFYMELRDAVQPDLVLVQMYLNDAQNSQIFRVRSVPPPFSSSRVLRVVAERFDVLRSRLWQDTAVPEQISPEWRETFRNGRDLHSGNMFDSRDGFDFEIYNAYMDFGLAWNPDSWRILERILRVWKEAVSETPARFAVAIFPVHVQVLGTLEDYRPQEECRRMCRRLGIAFHDVIPALRADWKARRERLFYDHCHYTPHGFQVIARDLFQWLREAKLIPP